ncbi:hypothetical protein [Arthrobacter sp. ISL-30]|uniref:hypothetical protein n=1 Tax=Arthrobacter sp. ISL-30 TaxID=2819109 RepID=UPI001BE84082|nr:hypothetical protein [Arthrobacter sp. ISL-30]MBT2514101.1 hypothetical protein [Arthrobacter sp. ISL-30]
MNRRPSAPKTAVNRPLPIALMAVALAMCLTAFPLATAHAEAADCAPGQAICLNPAPKPTQEPRPTQPPAEPPAPEPAEPQPAPAAPQETAAPAAPAPPAETATATPEATATDGPSPSVTATPIPSAALPSTAAALSTAPDWNKPIEENAKAKQAAVVVGKGGQGANTFALMAIMGGVLLIGLGGLAFALWGRNRLSSE